MIRRAIPPDILPVILTEFIARLPVGMYPVALLILVQQSTGSYAAAGAAVSAFSLASGVCAPVTSRLADRHGPRPILASLALVHGGVLVAFIFTANWLELAAVPAFTAAAGAASPPVSPVVRSLWTHRFADEDRVLRAVFSVEAVFGEAVFVLGPLLVGGCVAVAGARSAVAVGAGLAIVGTFTLVALRPVRSMHIVSASPSTSRLRRTALAAPGLRALVAMQILQFVGFSGIAIGVVSTASQWGAPAAGGLLLSMWAGASVLGAVAWGARKSWPGTPVTQLVCLLAGAAAGSAVLAIVSFASPAGGGIGTWVGVAVALLGGGVFLAPAAVVASTLVAQTAAPGQRTESFAWMSTASLLGSSAAAAVFGYLAEHHGGSAPLVAGAVSSTGALAVTLLSRTALTLDRAARPDQEPTP